MEIKKVLILGLGAIGSIYATKIFDYDSNSVSILLDESRIERYKKNGIVFNQKRYDFNYTLDSENSFKADLIILATKAVDFEKNAEEIRNYVGKNTIIMSFLNGISSEKILAEKYGEDKILYSFFVGHSSMKHNESIVFDGIGKIVFGERDNSNSQKVLAVKNFFDKVGINYEISKDMMSSMWQKFVINIGVNQALAILRMPFEALQKNKYAKEFAIGLMEEAVKIAKAENINNSESFIPNVLSFIDEIPPHCKPSMLQDIENKKPTEVDFFAGEIKRLGIKYGIETNFNNAAYTLLMAYNSSINK